jgi:hypothetical protein
VDQATTTKNLTVTGSCTGCGAGSQWTTAGSNLSYQGGNVGIGTANPQYALDVNGTVSASVLQIGDPEPTLDLSDGPSNFFSVSKPSGQVQSNLLVGGNGSFGQDYYVSGGTPGAPSDYAGGEILFHDYEAYHGGGYKEVCGDGMSYSPVNGGSYFFECYNADNTGIFGILLNGPNAANNGLGAQAGQPSIPGFYVEGAPSQTADLQQWQDAQTNVLSRIDSTGDFGNSVGAFSTLQSCDAGAEGLMRGVVDSSNNTWGATLYGGGSNHVLAYCDGTNWTVMGK